MSFFDAVFFDMDGLMVDSEPEWLQSEIDVTAPQGYTWLEEDQIACLGGPRQNPALTDPKAMQQPMT